MPACWQDPLSAAAWRRRLANPGQVQWMRNRKHNVFCCNRTPQTSTTPPFGGSPHPLSLSLALAGSFAPQSGTRRESLGRVFDSPSLMTAPLSVPVSGVVVVLQIVVTHFTGLMFDFSPISFLAKDSFPCNFFITTYRIHSTRTTQLFSSSLAILLFSSAASLTLKPPGQRNGCSQVIAPLPVSFDTPNTVWMKTQAS